MNSDDSKMIFKLLVLLSFAVVNAYVNYDSYKVYSVIPKTSEQVQILKDLRNNGYDFWTDVFSVGTDVRIMVSPIQNEEFLVYNSSVGLNAALKISNVQDLIDAQMKPSNTTRNTKTNLLFLHWDRYHNFVAIDSWIHELSMTYPGIVKNVTLGYSLEGRPISGAIIDFQKGARKKPLIGMIEGGIHAREWIAPATVTWIIKEFLTSTDPDVRFLAEAFVWHIIPVLNPDGYDYTFTTNRMWRKNRNPANFVNCQPRDDMGNGIDLNRNFNFRWMTEGASSNPCDETYAGPFASSELEAQAITNYVMKLKSSGNFIYYFAFHSFSQMILVPYSHASGFDKLQAKNYADMYEIAIRGAQKLENTHGTKYTVGTSAEILYSVTGASFDWVKGVADIPIVFLFELRDVGDYGFLLPPEQIIPNNEEIMACLIEMDKTARTLGYYQDSGASSVKAILSLAIGVAILIVVQ